MRDIIFRGKRTDNGEWVEGFVALFDANNSYIIRRTKALNSGGIRIIEKLKIDSRTVGQYTGLTDKNGKKIFEGDIVKGISYSTEWHGVIVWIDKIASFGVKYWSRETPTAWKNSSILMQIQNGRKDEFAAEIIGNIHDNPELLKGENDESEG